MKITNTPNTWLLAMAFVLFLSLDAFSQYCLPGHRSQLGIAPISEVVLGDIQNTSGLPLINIGYSDYTNLSTMLSAGTEYTMTITTEDEFQHNYSAWIDYNHDQVFNPEELLATIQIPTAFDNILTRQLTFTVPTWALNGTTRMRVRSSSEPYGPWMLTNDPCIPFSGNGEAEDYTIIIENGKESNLAVQRIMGPLPGPTDGLEKVTVRLRNLGNTAASGFTLHYTVNGGATQMEAINQTLQPGEVLNFSFSQAHDFSGLDCYDIKAWAVWASDEVPTDNETSKSICKMEPVTGEKAWYLHSNINGALEPLGGDPFYSTTNLVSMNTVFGENNWTQEYFESVNPSELFSKNSCFVFLDGSYNHTVPLENFLAANQELIEAWVAAGGKYFVNCSKEDGEKFYTDYGFDGVKASYFVISYAQATFEGHPVYDGPYQPTGTDWTGFYFGNAVLVGDGLSPVVHENDDYWQFGDPALHIPMVAEKPWGRGIAMFGTMGASQFLDPSPQPMNLRANILHYLSNCQSGSTGTHEHRPMERLVVFPNPTIGTVNILLPKTFKMDGRLMVRNSFGQLVLEQAVTAAKDTDLTISLPNLANGIYFLTLQDENHTMTERIILNR